MVLGFWLGRRCDRRQNPFDDEPVGALGKMHEWELHLHGAITNGVSKEEVRAIIHVIAIYCGVPQGVECFRIARKAFEDIEAADQT